MKSKLFSKNKPSQDKAGFINVPVFALAAGYCFFVLFLDRQYYCDAFLISFAPAALSLLLLLSGKKMPVLPKKEGLFIGIFSLLFIVMLSFVDIVRSTVKPLTADKTLGIIIAAFILIAVYACTYFVFGHIYLGFVKPRQLKECENDNKKPYLIYVLIIAFATLIFLAAADYGYDSSDIVAVYAYYYELGQWNDWHTVCYQMLLVLCTKLMPGAPYVFALDVVQSVMWIAVSAYALKSIYDTFHSLKVLRVYTVLSLIIISPTYYAPVAIKDTVFSLCMYAFCISIFNFLRKSENTAKDYVLLAVSATFAGLFRHIAVEVVALSLVILFSVLFVKRKSKKEIKKYLAVLLVPVVVFVGLSVGIGDGVLHKVKNPKYVTYTMPIYLSVACAEKLGDDFGSENAQVLERMMPLDEWIESYKQNIYWADTVTRRWGGVKNTVDKFDDSFFEGVININKDMVLHHPLQYFESVFEISSIVWRIGNPKDCTVFAPSGDVPATTEIYKPTVATEIMRTYLGFTLENTYLCSVVWRGGFWILSAIFSSYVLIKKKKQLLLLMIVPIVFYAASLFISIPSQDPRYVISFVEVGMFYSIIAFFDSKEKAVDS